MIALAVLAVFAVFGFVWMTNIGQLVHRTPTPTWWERLRPPPFSLMVLVALTALILGSCVYCIIRFA